jgi:hypothetical protein
MAEACSTHERGGGGGGGRRRVYIIYRIVVEKSEGNKHVGRPRRKWKNNTGHFKMMEQI